jgi:hypothetical protein
MQLYCQFQISFKSVSNQFQIQFQMPVSNSLVRGEAIFRVHLGNLNLYTQIINSFFIWKCAPGNSLPPLQGNLKLAFETGFETDLKLIWNWHKS